MPKIFKYYRWVTRRVRVSLKGRRTEYLKHKEAARALAYARLEFFNTHYKFKIGRIAIRNQKSRWGSCSRRGNLNFNYKIALLKPWLLDYIIVHELCHIAEFNHSSDFWMLVAQTIPNWHQLRGELKKLRL
ncbi:MAG: M48 family metallopeptidase [Candidatus Vogelbacteria bacterium]|nr:M48 family metallopeptidase [Candidatus Vogelbacteria bacterium]